MRRHIFFLILICLPINIISAQTKQNDPLGLSIPERLKPLLAKRIEQFVEVQQQEKWSRLFDFLSEGQFQFTDERKRCVTELFRDNPMLNFVILNTSTSTGNWGKPLDRKVWRVKGEAEIKTDSGNKKQSMLIAIRYFNRNWFFSVPDFYYETWKDKKFALLDLSAERKELLEVVAQPKSAAEIYDVSVKIDPESYVIRNYRFKIRNKTKKTITSYGYRFIENGQTVFSPSEIKPGGFATNSGFYGANHLFCEDKERPVRVYITEVKFSDGSKWKSK